MDFGRNRRFRLRIYDLLTSAGLGYRTDAPVDLIISGLTEDSRAVSQGNLFIARPGTKADGAGFARDAVDRGAVALVTQKWLDEIPVPQILVNNAANACSRLAQAYFGHPCQSVQTIGITGTNGKTTSTYLVRHILSKLGKRCGLIGTVEIDDGQTMRESDMTTPPPIELARLISTMKKHECDACAVEISSHSLDQHRVAGMKLSAAGFTNLTGDHLDYHKTMDAYAHAKSRLFNMLGDDGVAVVNGDDEWTEQIIQGCRARVVRYRVEGVSGGTASGGTGVPSVSSKDHILERITRGTPVPPEMSVAPESVPLSSDWIARNIRIQSSGTSFDLSGPNSKTHVQLRLVGLHNVQNALTAMLICIERFGLPVEDVARAISDSVGAPGRLERVVNPKKPRLSVLVDYAHSDDALANVLKALRPLTRGRLRVVFGCGGDRDPTKRPRMARVAHQLADELYITSDNPRTENPVSIIDEIVSGLSADERKTVFIDADRRKAISKAISDSDEDDVVLIAGKGHEKYQIMGTVKHHFDDVEEAMNV